MEKTGTSGSTRVEERKINHENKCMKKMETYRRDRVYELSEEGVSRT